MEYDSVMTHCRFHGETIFNVSANFVIYELFFEIDILFISVQLIECQIEMETIYVLLIWLINNLSIPVMR